MFVEGLKRRIVETCQGSEQGGVVLGACRSCCCCCAQVQMPSSLEYQLVECSLVVNAAGASSANLAEMLGVGAASKDAVAGVAVPVEPRKRSVVCLVITCRGCLLSTR